MNKAENINLLNWLEIWYSEQCDGDWEHQNGVEIGTLDNPGWYLTVDCEDISYLLSAHFAPIKIERDENNWIHCRLKDGKFEGFGGPKNLCELLTVFKHWVETLR